jgi:hypothetical protein
MILVTTPFRHISLCHQPNEPNYCIVHCVSDPFQVLDDVRTNERRSQQRNDRMKAMISMANKSRTKSNEEKTENEIINEKALAEWQHQDESIKQMMEAKVNNNGVTTTSSGEHKESKDGKSSDASSASSSPSTTSTPSKPSSASSQSQLSSITIPDHMRDELEMNNLKWLGSGKRRAMGHTFDDVTIGDEGWRSCEVLFNSSLLAPVDTQIAAAERTSIQTTIVDALMACPSALRPILVHNIRLTGNYYF